RALQYQLRDHWTRKIRVDDHIGLEGSVAPDAIEVDGGLVEGFDNVRIVAVAAVLALELDIVVGVGRRRTHDMHRIIGETAGDRRCTRPQSRAARADPVMRPDPRFLNDVIVVIEAVDGRYVRRVGIGTSRAAERNGYAPRRACGDRRQLRGRAQHRDYQAVG